MKLKLKNILKYNPTREEYRFSRLMEENESLYIELFNLIKNDYRFDAIKYLENKYLEEKKIYSVASSYYHNDTLQFIQLFERNYKGWKCIFNYKKVKYVAYVDQEKNVSEIRVIGMEMEIVIYPNMPLFKGKGLEEIHNYATSRIIEERDLRVNKKKKKIKEEIEHLKRIEKYYNDILNNAN